MIVSQRADDAVCRAILRCSGSNFALPLQLLPAEKRRGSIALYAFCRLADDLVDDADSEAEAASELDSFVDQLKRALAGQAVEQPVLRAVAAAAGRFAVPPEHLFAILEGVRSDLRPVRYQSVDDLVAYCRLVASAVGLAAVPIWGVLPGVACHEWQPAADACGLAFQWTNILRDVVEDRDRGRIYLPVESFAQAGCCVDDFLTGTIGESFARLVGQEVARADDWFLRAQALDEMLSPDGRRVFRGMFGVYRELFRAVERAGPAIFWRRVRPPRWRRLTAGLTTLYGGPS
jgi:phytoene synthase